MESRGVQEIKLDVALQASEAVFSAVDEGILKEVSIPNMKPDGEFANSSLYYR